MNIVRMIVKERLALLLLLKKRRSNRALQKKRRNFPQWWVHPIIRKRDQQGAYNNLVKDLRGYPERFFNFHRLTIYQFDRLLALIKPIIKKLHVTREPLSPGLKLSLTLRYLASGDSMISLHYLYYVGRSTIPKIIADTTEAIWNVLMPLVLPVPSADTWTRISKEFEDKWDFPNCVGAIDGKHVTVQCFKKSGSKFFNYKGRFSTVIMAVCDANLKFTYVSIGSAGRESDGGIFQSTDFGYLLESGDLPLPKPSVLPYSNTEVPKVFVADGAFPLLPNLMRPYPGANLIPNQTIFNYRLSRARRLIENTFGVLVTRWRIFRKIIVANIEKVDSIVKACVVLHNWIRDQELKMAPKQRRYMPPGTTDHEDQHGIVIDGDWRKENTAGACTNLAVNNTRKNSSKEAKQVRDLYTKYFMKEGHIDWQWEKLPYFQRARFAKKAVQDSDEETQTDEEDEDEVEEGFESL